MNIRNQREYDGSCSFSVRLRRESPLKFLQKKKVLFQKADNFFGILIFNVFTSPTKKQVLNRKKITRHNKANTHTHKG